MRSYEKYSTSATALEYAGMGYPVLPLLPGEKRPHGRLVPSGLRDASTDPEVLRRWWQAAPGAGVGILPPAETLALDCDVPSAWGALLAEYPELGEAPRQRTPRGGVHVFLRLPAGLVGSLTSSARKLPGVDLRGLGKAYLAAAPTTLPNGAYVWELPLLPPAELPLAPEGLLARLLPDPPPPPPEYQPARLRGIAAGTHTRRLEGLLRWACERVAAAPQGQRHNTLLGYARLIGGYLHLGLDPEQAAAALVAAAVQAGLPPLEAEATARDGLRYGQAAPLEPPAEKARASNPYDPGGEAAKAPTCPLDGRTGGGLVLGKPRYKIERGQIWAAKPEKQGEGQGVGYYPLSNFAAIIEREIAATDGLENETLFEIKGYTSTGRPLPAAWVRAGEFAGMNWTARHWGSEAVVLPGQSNRDHLRAAIQFLSLEGLRRTTVYRHLGWAKVDGQWVYLHAGGGIGANGGVEGLEVQPGRVFEGFALPDPPEDEAEREAIRTLWSLREVAPSRVTVPLLLYALGAPLGHSPYSLYLAGPTGSRKTSLALVIQSLWGHHDTPPASWETTTNALEALAFTGMDTPLLVDDYAPQASEQKQKELQAKAARLLRSQGNGTGRGRMRADGSLAGDKPPRGSLLLTGEDVPPGHSVRARCLFLELGRGEVRLDRLSEAQTLAREGAYARALSGWVRWLARDLEAHRDRLRSRIEGLRPRYNALHGRVTDALARLHALWELYQEYTATVGCDLEGEGEVLEALEQVLQGQGEYLRGADPVERFGPLLFSALRMGRGHLVPLNWRPGRDIEDHLPDPARWGWRYRETTSGHPDARGVWEPLGPQIGWLPDDPEVHGLYLDPTAAYTVLGRLANESGEPLPTERTLWKRLAERGVIHVRVEAGVTRYQARVRIGSGLIRAIHLAGVYIAKSGNSGNNEHSAVQDGTNPVPTKRGVPTQEWEQSPASDAASQVFPLASGNTQKTGNSLNHVQDGTKPTVPTVPTSTDIRGSRVDLDLEDADVF
ncbi:Bifunctional DNA primase/polymerase [Allomeiothermus silvanus DSM 9946]|uniref:Bifunctional DNA primase/polymerase n=1 Tax=Allomeiothermus silvanus (strain ATCC 700542 / DSM 9946 / NBRC 106475 / NCIMB 13440 / VI-R2) TaxID=526227 RepID=D7BFB5_ALLS1|nr:bifunctional DNA primase/polymerase [Allomeiothermus silvanus]ADH63468.1 Bifunctional DNA primase/polymerase [Allomeiothermus silvanus DSM 9946]